MECGWLIPCFCASSSSLFVRLKGEFWTHIYFSWFHGCWVWIPNNYACAIVLDLERICIFIEIGQEVQNHQVRPTECRLRSTDLLPRALFCSLHLAGRPSPAVRSTDLLCFACFPYFAYLIDFSGFYRFKLLFSVCYRIFDIDNLLLTSSTGFYKMISQIAFKSSFLQFINSI